MSRDSAESLRVIGIAATCKSNRERELFTSRDPTEPLRVRGLAANRDESLRLTRIMRRGLNEDK